MSGANYAANNNGDNRDVFLHNDRFPIGSSFPIDDLEKLYDFSLPLVNKKTQKNPPSVGERLQTNFNLFDFLTSREDLATYFELDAKFYCTARTETVVWTTASGKRFFGKC